MTTTTTPKSRPILFNGEMVRALLDGRKFQTRRPVKGVEDCTHLDAMPEWWRFSYQDGNGIAWVDIDPPLGQPGDLLWVRETFTPIDFNDYEVAVIYDATPYRNTRKENNTYWLHAGREETEKWYSKAGQKCPSIHMPRWASRITLEITDVRVERVQEISHDDCLAEGVDGGVWYSTEGPRLLPAGNSNARNRFQQLWDRIYANKPEDEISHPWEANPWVWVYEFKRQGAQP